MTQPKDQIRKNSIWVVIGKFAEQTSQFLFGVILARLLTPEDFGLVVAIQIFTGLAGFISGAGMGGALIQAKQVHAAHFQVVFTVQLLICCVIYALFYYSAPYLADYMRNPIYTDLIRVSALSFLTRPFLNVPRSKLIRDMKFNIITTNAIISGLATGIASITFAHYNHGVWSLIWGGLVGAITIIPLTIYFARLPLRIKYDYQIAKNLGIMGAKFTANDILVYLRNQAPNFIIGKTLGPYSVGLFNKGESLSAYPFSFIAASAYDTVFRALSSYQDNLDKSKYIFLRTITLVTTYTFPFYVGLLWTSEEFIITIFGEKWLPAAAPLQIISISRMFACIGNPSGAVLAAQNTLGAEIILQFISLVTISAGCWYGTKQGDLTIISLALLPGIVFIHLTATLVAMNKIRVSLHNLLTALKPAIILNSLLFVELAVTAWALDRYQPNLEIKLRLFCLVTSGSAFYTFLFLALPIQSLKSEAEKWKGLLRIKKYKTA